MSTVQSTPGFQGAPVKASVGRRIIKWGLIGIVLLIVLVVALVVGAYYSLRSPAFYERALPYAKPFLDPLGIEIKKLGSLSFDVFGSLELHDLDAHYKNTKVGDIDVNIGTLVVRYDFDGLFHQQLNIHALELKDVLIKGTLKPETTQTPPPTSKPVQDWVALDKILSSPPMATHIESLKIENLAVDLRVESGKTWQHVNAQLRSVSTRLAWTSELLEGKAALRLSKDKDIIRFAFGNENERTDASLTPTLDFDADWRAAKTNNRWRVDKLIIDQHAAISNPDIKQTHSGKIAPIGALKVFGIDLHVDAKTVENPSLEPGLASIFPLAIRAKLTSATQGLVVDGFKQEQMLVSGRLDHQLSASLQGELHPFPSPPPQIRFDLSQSLNIPDMDVRLPGQHAKLKNFELTIQAKGDAPLDTKLSKPISLSAKIKGGADQVKIEKSTRKPNDASLLASLSPTFSLTADGELKSLADAPKGLNLRFSPDLHVKNISVTQGTGKAAQNIRVARQDMAAKGAFDGAQIQLDGSLDTINAVLSQLKKPVTLNNKFSISTNLAATHVGVKLQTRLDDKPLLNADLAIDNLAKHLDVRHDIELEASTHLRAIHAAADALKKTGGVHVTLHGKSRLDHAANDIRLADMSKLATWPMQSQGELRIAQRTRPTDAEGIVLSAPLTLTYDIAKTEDYNTHLKLDVPAVQTPPLRVPVALTLSQNTRFSWPLTVTETDGSLGIDGVEALAFRLRLDDKPNNAHIHAALKMTSDPIWQRYLADLKVLNSVGKLGLDVNLDAQLNHPNMSVLDFQPKAHLEKSRAHVKLALGVQPYADNPGSELHLSGPLKLTQTLDWAADSAIGEGEFEIAALKIPNKANIAGLSGRWKMKADSGFKPKSAHIDFTLDRSQIELVAALTGDKPLRVGDLLTPLTLQATAAMDEQQAELRPSSLSVGGELIGLVAKGAASFDRKNAQLETTLTLRPRNNLLGSPDISGSGKLELPLSVTLFKGEQITLEGEARFDDFSFRFNDKQLQHLNGRMKVEEELLWRDKTLRFRYLSAADPFQRVDFSRIEPYLGKQQSVTFSKVSSGAISAGPGLASMAFKQNLLQLQHFDVELFDGHATGQFYLDARPGAWRIGVVSRLTQVDPRYLLSDKNAASAKVRAPISARTALEFDVNRRLLEGRVDVTEINRDQLLQLLDIVDPNHTDEQLASVRSALRFAYPKEVALDMRDGLMDLKVTLSALPNPIRVRGLPLSPLVQAFIGDALRSVEKLPLK